MATYEEYLAQGVDPATARAWADADAEDEDIVADEATTPRRVEPDRVGRETFTTTTQNAAQFWSSHEWLLTEDPEVSDLLHETRLRLGPAPDSAIGRDQTGTVRVHVDRAHTPVRLEVRADWAEEVSATTLPAAIMVAYRAALDIQYQEARDAEAAGYGEPQWLPPVPDYFPLDDYHGTPRSPYSASMIEDVRAVSDRGRRYVEEMKAEIEGTKSHELNGEFDESVTEEPQTVIVHLDGHQMMVDCQINAKWAPEVTAARLMDEFYVALQRAKNESEVTELSPLQRERQSLMAELNNLTSESLAALRDLARGQQ